MNYLRKTLLEYKKNNRLAQWELAEAIGCHQSYATLLETGKQNVTYKFVSKLDNFDVEELKAQLAELLMNIDDPEKLCTVYNLLYEKKASDEIEYNALYVKRKNKKKE